MEEENSRNTLLEQHIESLNEAIKILQYQVITANRAAAYAINKMNNMTGKTPHLSKITTIVE